MPEQLERAQALEQLQLALKRTEELKDDVEALRVRIDPGLTMTRAKVDAAKYWVRSAADRLKDAIESLEAGGKPQHHKPNEAQN